MGNLFYTYFTKNLYPSAHDVSDGGIALALCELAIVNGLGFEVTAGSLKYFFNETQARYIISINPLKEKELTYLARENNVFLTKLGVAKGSDLCFGLDILSLNDVNDLYHNVISNMMDN